MTEELTRKIVAWATELAVNFREVVHSVRTGNADVAKQQDAVILADACVGAARRIMTELLAQRAGVPRGRA